MFLHFFLLVDSKNFFQGSFESFCSKHKAPHIIKSAFLISFHRILQSSKSVVSVDHKWKTVEGEMKMWNGVFEKFCG